MKWKNMENESGTLHTHRQTSNLLHRDYNTIFHVELNQHAKCHRFEYNGNAYDDVSLFFGILTYSKELFDLALISMFRLVFFFLWQLFTITHIAIIYQIYSLHLFLYQYQHHASEISQMYGCVYSFVFRIKSMLFSFCQLMNRHKSNGSKRTERPTMGF